MINRFITLLSPRRRAAKLAYVAAHGGRQGRLARQLLMTLHGCDVSPGATIGSDLRLPHPVGIVIGQGTIVGNSVTIYQNVTLGQSRGHYPQVGDHSTIYPGAVVAGSVSLAALSIVQSNSTLIVTPPSPESKIR